MSSPSSVGRIPTRTIKAQTNNFSTCADNTSLPADPSCDSCIPGGCSFGCQPIPKRPRGQPGPWDLSVKPQMTQSLREMPDTQPQSTPASSRERKEGNEGQGLGIAFFLFFFLFSLFLFFFLPLLLLSFPFQCRLSPIFVNFSLFSLSPPVTLSRSVML